MLQKKRIDEHYHIVFDAYVFCSFKVFDEMLEPNFPLPKLIKKAWQYKLKLFIFCDVCVAQGLGRSKSVTNFSILLTI